MTAMAAGGDTLVLGVHHVGTVIASLDEAVSLYCGALGFHREGGVVHDPVQQVYIQFLRDASGTMRLELIEPAGAESPVAAALRKGGGLNHLCFETKDLDQAVHTFRKRGAVLLSKPVPALALGGARVAFLYNRLLGVFELVESPALVPPGR